MRAVHGHCLALSGGVGGAKLALGLSRILPPEALTIVCNTADDFDHLGLRVCPDLDTVMYTLAGVANRVTGWGQAHETWSFLEALSQLGGETWFRLGDRDLATHVERTRRAAGRREPDRCHGRALRRPRRRTESAADDRRPGADRRGRPVRAS